MPTEKTLPEFPALNAVADADLFCGYQTDLGHWTGSQVKTYAANAAPVQSVNTQTGAVALDTDEVPEGTTNLYFTNARADARIAAQKDVANGLATLDASVLVPLAQIPQLPQSQITSLSSDLALKAPLSSPSLTGTPTAPTAPLSTNTTQIASTAFVQSQIASSISNSKPFRGQYDASSNLFPSTGGSGTGGAIQAGDNWVISVGGTLGGQTVLAGDSLIAIVNTPGQTSTNWQIINQGLGYTPENVANKSTDGTLAANSAILYPSQSAVKTYADGKVADAIANGVTTIAPSQNAVYNALAGKEPTITTLSIAKGGTNSSTALNNNRVMVSSGGSIVETTAITASRALASDTNGIPVASATTATELGYLAGTTSSVQTQLNGKLTASNNLSDLTNTTTARTNIGLGNVQNVDTTNASNISTGTLADARLSSNVTVQGNSFNIASKLVQLDVSARLPAVDGSQLTGLTKTQVGLSNVANVDTTNASNISSGTLNAARLPVVPIGSGGTNSSTALNNNRVMVSSTGSIIEASAITASRALASDINGLPTASATTATELGYVSGVTSAIQTQINGKEPTITTLSIAKGGTNSGTALNNNRIMRSSGGAVIEASAITASRALISDSNGIPTHSSVTSTQLGYLASITHALPDFYEQGVSLTMGGAVPNTSLVTAFIVIGAMVYMSFVGTTATSNSATVLTVTGFPAGLLPVRDQRGFIGVQNNTNYFIAPFYFTAAGTMTIYNNNQCTFAGNFTSGVTVGVLPTTISWSNVY